MGSRARFEVVPWESVSAGIGKQGDKGYILDSSALDSVGAESSVANKLLGRLVVDRGEGGEFGEELIEERWG